MGLKEIQDSLRAANDEYAKLTAQRTGNKAASIKEASAAVRLRMDDLYDDMTTIAFVQSVAAPTAETTRFVNELNALIDETTALQPARRCGEGGSQEERIRDMNNISQQLKKL